VSRRSLTVADVVRSLAVAVPFVGAAIAGSGCDGGLVHAFGGYAYDATNDCLETSGVVDVISGPDPGMCKQVRCWVSPDGFAYVTNTACDAPIGFVDQTEATTGVCVKALAAYMSEDHGLCPAPPDGGAEAGP
jgi:hypothetical protein